MISKETFAKLCKERIDAGEPFLAYMHEHGYMLMRTGTIKWTEYEVHYVGMDGRNKVRCVPSALDADNFVRSACKRGEIMILNSVEAVEKSRKVKASTVSRARKKIASLKKRVWPLYVVEYDGTAVTSEGLSPDDF